MKILITIALSLLLGCSNESYVELLSGKEPDIENNEQFANFDDNQSHHSYQYSGLGETEGYQKNIIEYPSLLVEHERSIEERYRSLAIYRKDMNAEMIYFISREVLFHNEFPATALVDLMDGTHLRLIINPNNEQLIDIYLYHIDISIANHVLSPHAHAVFNRESLKIYGWFL